MRKSRVVNLGDNILCETFLFLVQRELQRQQGRATHSHWLFPLPPPLPPTLHTGLQADGGCCAALPPPHCLRCQSHGKWRVQCARCFWPVQKQRRWQKETTTLARDLCPFPADLPSPSTRCVGVCVCCGGAAVATFYCFCCIASRSSAGVGHGGGWRMV